MKERDEEYLESSELTQIKIKLPSPAIQKIKYIQQTASLSSYNKVLDKGVDILHSLLREIEKGNSICIQNPEGKIISKELKLK